MNFWPMHPLEALVRDGQISYGVVQPGQESTQGIPLVRVKDIKNGRIDTSNPLRVNEAVAGRHGRTTLVGGELLLTLVGTVGESAVVPATLRGWNVARAIAVLRPEGVSSRWLQICFGSPRIRAVVDSLLNTTVQATLNLSDLKRIQIPVPHAAVRAGIEQILGALDDKIAANAKIAATADELAVTKYRQALASATYTDVTFADLAKVSGGGTPSTKEPTYWDGDIRWATPTDTTALAGPYLEATSRTITETGLSACASELYPEGSILMTSRATIGAFALAQVPTAVNQGFIVVQPNDPQLHLWIFHEMRSRVDEFISLANGATFLELSRGNFKKFKVRTASPDIMHSFNEIAMGLHRAARGALLENKTLAATRDALLPQLMSGKLRVRDAEAVVDALL